MGRMANNGKVWTFIMMVMKAMYSRTLMKPAGQSVKWALLPLYFTLRTIQGKTAQMNNSIDIWDHGKCNCSLVGTIISPVMEWLLDQSLNWFYCKHLNSAKIWQQLEMYSLTWVSTSVSYFVPFLYSAVTDEVWAQTLFQLYLSLAELESEHQSSKCSASECPYFMSGEMPCDDDPKIILIHLQLTDLWLL